MAIFSKKKETTKDAKDTKEVKKTSSVKADSQAKSMKELYEEKAVSKSSAKVKTKIGPNSQSYRVLVKPLITEKAADLNGLHKYAFAVAIDANKISVMKAIEELYGIKPIKVNVINFSGKLKTRGRIKGKRKDWKKAIVTLPAGATLDVYEGV